jgi:hypothetical protein
VAPNSSKQTVTDLLINHWVFLEIDGTGVRHECQEKWGFPGGQLRNSILISNSLTLKPIHKEQQTVQ